MIVLDIASLYVTVRKFIQMLLPNLLRDSEAAQLQSIYFCPNKIRELQQVDFSFKSHSRGVWQWFCSHTPPGHHVEPGIAIGCCWIHRNYGKRMLRLLQDFNRYATQKVLLTETVLFRSSIEVWLPFIRIFLSISGLGRSSRQRDYGFFLMIHRCCISQYIDFILSTISHFKSMVDPASWDWGKAHD